MLNKTLQLMGFAAAGLLVGCGGGGGGGGSTPTVEASAVVAQLAASGAMLSLDRSSTVAGTDANGDGVRDDVAAWIRAQGYSADQVSSATQLAKAYQKVLLLDLTNSTAVAAARLASSNAVECVMQKAPTLDDGYKTVSNLRRVTVNTSARTAAYLAYAEKVNDTVSVSPEGNGCE